MVSKLFCTPRKEDPVTYPNAQAGLKKLFSAQILGIIGTILIIITGAIGVFTAASMEGGVADETIMPFALGTLFAAIPSLIIPIVSLILSLVGLKRASEDNGNFKIAFYASAFALVVSIVSGFFPEFQFRGVNVLDRVASIADIVVFAYVIEGIKEIGGKIGRSDLVSSCNTIEALYIVGIIGANVLEIFAVSPLATEFVGYAGSIALLLILVAKILYIVVIGKAQKALQQA